MRVLLDECLPRALKRELPEHEVRTVPELGWARGSDAEVLRRAAGKFDVFVTADRGLRHQQNLSRTRIAVILLRGPSNRAVDLRPLMPELRQRLPMLRPAQVITLGVSIR